MSYVVDRLLGLAVVLVLASAFAPASGAQTPLESNCSRRVAMWDFFVDSGLGANAQQAFMDHFCAQMSKVEAWGAEYKWPVPSGVARLKIFVGKHYELARSIVPAWEGDRGRIEIPERRALANTADIAHEIFHVYFPNGNRMLAEGMAVYVQEETGLNNAYPNEGHPVHTLVKCKAGALLVKVDLSKLDNTVTPDGIALKITEIKPSQQPAYAYVIAGSFVRYLIETYGMDKFHDFYDRTQFEAGRRVQRATDDWSDKQLYARSLPDLEQDWKAMITGLNVSCPASAMLDEADPL